MIFLEKEDYLKNGLRKRACERAFQLESKDFYEFIDAIDKYVELKDSEPSN